MSNPHCPTYSASSTNTYAGFVSTFFTCCSRSVVCFLKSILRQSAMHQTVLPPPVTIILIGRIQCPMAQRLLVNTCETFEHEQEIGKWSSLVEGDEQPDQPNSQTHTECCRACAQSLFWVDHKHKSLPLAPIQPSSP